VFHGGRKDDNMRRLIPALVLAAILSPHATVAQSTPRPDADPRIATLVATVSEARLRRLVETLAGFGTRHTLSDPTAGTRGIGAAQRWIFDELRRSSHKLQVSFDTHKVAQQGRITRAVDLRNVLAVLPGKSPRRIYIGAHYDTVSISGEGQISANTRPAGAAPPADPQLRADQDYNVDAPGANDNGSGTALTMELARVFAESGVEFEATFVFALWAGEEQGLIGSRAHAQRIAAEKVPVEAAFNNDIVGNSRGGDGIVDAESVRVYSEGPEDSMSRSLARYVNRIAARYVPAHRVRLMARHDRFSRGSDHSSFNQHGFPAIVFREANENFAMQHAATDTIEGVDYAYLTRNTLVNAATAASLALGPPAPTITNERGQLMIGRQPSGYDANLRWNASPGAGAYRVYWRDTWTNDWQHMQLVGNVTEFVLPNMSIDDYVFGVAAVGADGHESLVSAYVSPLRRDPEVKLVQP
jgi:pectin methylesterase-like acyl-CoA thioesterase